MLKQHNLPLCAFKVHMSELQVLGALEGRSAFQNRRYTYTRLKIAPYMSLGSSRGECMLKHQPNMVQVQVLHEFRFPVTNQVLESMILAQRIWF